ncbi:hypothetical protein D9613_009246 [Agrocybe pediades]|uniref:Uncharacterized protein n=1 Tax=Agrocybe pediades TaxID=84607 RepID=A0A8H4R2Q7_9AGAR|nr:hypothetical protein D9613_009246 [Agrocybe pediades]
MAIRGSYREENIVYHRQASITHFGIKRRTSAVPPYVAFEPTAVGRAALRSKRPAICVAHLAHRLLTFLFLGEDYITLTTIYFKTLLRCVFKFAGRQAKKKIYRPCKRKVRSLRKLHPLFSFICATLFEVFAAVVIGVSTVVAFLFMFAMDMDLAAIVTVVVVVNEKIDDVTTVVSIEDGVHSEDGETTLCSIDDEVVEDVAKDVIMDAIAECANNDDSEEKQEEVALPVEVDEVDEVTESGEKTPTPFLDGEVVDEIKKEEPEQDQGQVEGMSDDASESIALEEARKEEEADTCRKELPQAVEPRPVVEKMADLRRVRPNGAPLAIFRAPHLAPRLMKRPVDSNGNILPFPPGHPLFVHRPEVRVNARARQRVVKEKKVEYAPRDPFFIVVPSCFSKAFGHSSQHRVVTPGLGAKITSTSFSLF